MNNSRSLDVSVRLKVHSLSLFLSLCRREKVSSYRVANETDDEGEVDSSSVGTLIREDRKYFADLPTSPRKKLLRGYDRRNRFEKTTRS